MENAGKTGAAGLPFKIADVLPRPGHASILKEMPPQVVAKAVKTAAKDR